MKFSNKVRAVAVATLGLLSLSAALPPAATAQSDVLGKTPAQIAAMGMEAWTEFYAKKEGRSTANEANAAAAYARSLRTVNDRRIAAADLSPSARKKLNSLRAAATAYSVALLEIEARDGGTMWIPVRAGSGAGVEYLIADLIPILRRSSVSPSPARKSEIATLLQQAEAGLKTNEAIVAGSDALAPHAQAARKSLEIVKNEYASPAWPGSVVVLQWFADRSGAPAPLRYPALGSAERKAILDALRKPVEKVTKLPVTFLVGNDGLRVQGAWAFLQAKTLDKNEKPLGEAFLWGETAALLRRESGEWTVLHWGFSSDTGVMDHAMQKYPDAPRSLFGLPD